jgi:large subunit ribosomal protein L19
MKPEIVSLIHQKYAEKNPPLLQAGDTVRVHQKIREGEKERIQIFEGLVIATKHGAGLDGTFTVRKIAVGGVGVERVFPVHSPNIVKVERTKTARVRRAKLYYMRDRLGKSARFKNEKPNPTVWVEPEEKAEELMVTDEEPQVTEAAEAETIAVADATAEEPVAEPEEASAIEKPAEEIAEEPVAELIDDINELSEHTEEDKTEEKVEEHKA